MAFQKPLVVSDVSEFVEFLFRNEEGDFVIPDPRTCVFLTRDDCEQRATPNDLLCHKGEESLNEVVEIIGKQNTRTIIFFRLTIPKAEKLMTHPVIRLKELPTLMRLDGIIRISGGDLLEMRLVWEVLVSEPGPWNPTRLYQDYSSRWEEGAWWNGTPRGAAQHPEGRVFEEVPESREREPAGLPAEMRFWDLKRVQRVQKDLAEKLAGLMDMKTEEGTRHLEGIIRSQFAAKEVPSGKGEAEAGEPEAIVPLDLDDLLSENKVILEFERYPRPEEPPLVIEQPPPKQSVKKEKGKKGKGGKAKGGKGKGGKDKGGKGKGKGKKK